VLARIPQDLQQEGLSLASLQAALKGRWRGHSHPGELGVALRKLEHRALNLNRRDSYKAGFVIHFRKEVICDAESLFA
jgi:hypothetical protein